MTTPNPVSSERPSRKRPLNEFLFKIVNSFNIDEFKQYTNFTELQQEAIDRTVGSAPQKMSIDDRIRRHFRKNVPDESKWRRGGFNELELTEEFYASALAKRILKAIYGLKECVVVLTPLKENRDSENFEEPPQLSSNQKDVVAKIDLTTSDKSSVDTVKPPKRQLKYPRKVIPIDKSTAISGIHTYKAPFKFVENIPTTTTSQCPKGFDNEINVSSAEPATTLSKRIEVISNIVLVPPTPFRDEANQRQPEPTSSSLCKQKQTVGPKSKVQQRRVAYIDEESEELPVSATVSINETSKNLPKPKIGPESQMSQYKNLSVDLRMKSTQELAQDLMYISSVKTPYEPSVSPVRESTKPKPKIGPKSRLKQTRNSSVAPIEKTTEKLQEYLMYTDPSSTVIKNELPTKSSQTIDPPEHLQERSSKVGVPTIEPRRNFQLPPEKLSKKSMHTGSPIELCGAKPKVGPKSRMSKTRSLSVDSTDKTTQELLQDLMFTDPSSILTINEPPTEPSTAPKIKFCIDPKSAMPNRQESQAEEPPQKSKHTGPSIEPPFKKSKCIDRTNAKPKIGPKSQMDSTTLSTRTPSPAADESLRTNRSVVPEDMQGVFRPNCPANMPASSQRDGSSRNIPVEPHLNNTPEKTSYQQHIGLKDQMYEFPQTHTNPLPVTRVGIAGSDTLTESSGSSELRNNLKRSAERAAQHISKYLAEIDPNVQSEKHFWHDFFKWEFEDDSSAAETQLDNSITTPYDHESEAHSQAILRPDQLDAKTVDEIQMGVQPAMADQLEAENVDEIQTDVHLSVVNPHPVHFAKHYDVSTITNIKLEVVDNDNNESCSSDVQIIELPPDEPIEILMDDTQQLYANLQVDRNDTEEWLMPIVIPEPPSKKISPAAGTSKGFLTSLPVIATKKRNYQPLDIVVEAVPKMQHVEFLAFSQQHLTPPSNENYQIEEFTMTESQHQWYALLNDENTIFLSSQLENYALNTGKTPDPKSSVMHSNLASQPLALKRLSQDTLNRQPCKRRRCDETIKRELNWKIMDIRSITFKPLANYTFHLELQLRNNYDTYHIQEQSSIKRILQLNNNEWKHVVRILTALKGYQYDSSATVIATRTLDLPTRLMDCFVQSIPIFVRSSVQFTDFMGHCLLVSEQQPLRGERVDGAIDPNILRQMGELKKTIGLE